MLRPSAQLRTRRTMTARKRITPKLSLRGFHLLKRSRSTLRIARHEAVVTELGYLEPLVPVGRESVHRLQYLLEVRIGRGSFGVQFLRRLQVGLHDRRPK